MFLFSFFILNKEELWWTEKGPPYMFDVYVCLAQLNEEKKKTNNNNKNTNGSREKLLFLQVPQ